MLLTVLCAADNANANADNTDADYVNANADNIPMLMLD